MLYRYTLAAQEFNDLSLPSCTGIQCFIAIPTLAAQEFMLYHYHYPSCGAGIQCLITTQAAQEFKAL